METSKYMLVVEDLASNDGAVCLPNALLELGAYIEALDTSHQNYEKNVVLLMRIAACIWKQLHLPT